MEPPVRNTLQAKLVLDGEVIPVTLDYHITGEYAFLNKVPLLTVQTSTLQLEAKVCSPILGVNLMLVSCKEKYLLCSSAEPEKKLSEIRDLIDEAEIVACCPYTESFETELRSKYSLPKKTFPLNATTLASIKLAFLSKLYPYEEKNLFEEKAPFEEKASHSEIENFSEAAGPAPPPYGEELPPQSGELQSPSEAKVSLISLQSMFRDIMKENDKTVKECIQILAREESSHKNNPSSYSNESGRIGHSSHCDKNYGSAIKKQYYSSHKRGEDGQRSK
jgi:hypothetical protein